MASKKKLTMADQLNALPKVARFSAAEHKCIQETVTWYKEAVAAGESVPSFASLARFLKDEHNITVSASSIRNYCQES